MIDIWSVHMDPDYWPDPEHFRPERHLNKAKSDHILTFGLGTIYIVRYLSMTRGIVKVLRGSIFSSFFFSALYQGKRSCIGETLARNSLFLFFALMMQRFRFLPPASSNPVIDLHLQPSMEPIPGLTLSPRPCLARIIDRIQWIHFSSSFFSLAQQKFEEKKPFHYQYFKKNAFPALPANEMD